MLQPANVVKTAPCENPSQFDLDGMKHAFFQGQLGLQEGGVPIGAALVKSGKPARSARS
jgi:creatinine deaminase